MRQFATIVVGASLGGVEALQKLVSALPAELPAAIFIVQHIGRHRSVLPEILTASGPLPAAHAMDGQAVVPGTITIAPPDHHLVLELGAARLTRGPRENSTRPAADPLFRSAAKHYGRDVIGVILTGALSDGTAGLREVRRRGGIAVIQHPLDAQCPSMPESALRHAGADFCVGLSEMPGLLAKLSTDISRSAGFGLVDTVAVLHQINAVEVAR